MPAVKLGRPQRDPLRELIAGVMHVLGKETADAAAILGVSQPTALKRLRDPQTLTIEELKKLSRGLGIPIEEIRAAIRF